MSHPGHIYHWKHGWIPLDHTAAMSKAKGNKDAADRMLADAHGSTAGIANKQDVAKAVLDMPNISDPAERRRAKLHIIEAADRLDAADSLPTAWQGELRARREQRAITNAHVVARTTPTPTAEDYTRAAEMWKAQNPGKKIAGNERQVSEIADELWRKKRLQSENTGSTAAEKQAELDRKRRAASHSHTFKALGLDKQQTSEGRTLRGVDQFGNPSTFTGTVVGQSVANMGDSRGVVYSIHNGSDRSGLDASSRGTVFVPDAPGQARSMTPDELRRQNQGDFITGEEVAIKVGGGTRIGRIQSVAPDGRLVVHIDGHGKVTRSAEDLSRSISASTRAAEARRSGGEFSKTPLSRLLSAVEKGGYPEPMMAAMRAELARRLKG